MTFNSSLSQRLTSIIDQAISQKIASSIALGIGFGRSSSKDIVIYAGQTHKWPTVKTSEKTLFDLASLTKILGTTLAVAQAIESGKIGLDEKPFIEWPQITVRQLLAHKTGLPAHVKFYELLPLVAGRSRQNQQLILTHLRAIMPQKASLTRVYSDVGFIALGWLLEERYKKPLWDIFKQTWQALALNCQFEWFSSQPLSYENNNYHIAPTGFCQARQKMVVGQVHDPNCYYMGGLAGHAGLFSRLDTVMDMGQFFLRSVLRPTNEIEHLLKRFAKEALGFDQVTLGGTMNCFSKRTFGHFGYTGVSVCIDPDFDQQQGLVVSLLTNRVHCSHNPAGIFWLRRAINRAVVKKHEQ